MRILLDENMPLDFGRLLPSHEVQHVEDLGLKGTRNGALLSLARSSYEAFVTLDRGILHQHNHTGQSLIIVAVRVQGSLQSSVLAAAPHVASALASATPGDLIELPAE